MQGRRGTDDLFEHGGFGEVLTQGQVLFVHAFLRLLPRVDFRRGEICRLHRFKRRDVLLISRVRGCCSPRVLQL